MSEVLEMEKKEKYKNIVQEKIYAIVITTLTFKHLTILAFRLLLNVNAFSLKLFGINPALS